MVELALGQVEHVDIRLVRRGEELPDPAYLPRHRTALPVATDEPSSLGIRERQPISSIRSPFRPRGGSVTPEAGPRVLLVASTIRNTLPGQEIPKIYAEGAPNLSAG